MRLFAADADEYTLLNYYLLLYEFFYLLFIIIFRTIRCGRCYSCYGFTLVVVHAVLCYKFIEK